PGAGSAAADHQQDPPSQTQCRRDDPAAHARKIEYPDPRTEGTDDRLAALGSARPPSQRPGGRPVFSCGRLSSTWRRVAMSRRPTSATPMRSNSLFLTSTPAFRQACLTAASTAYSSSGMVKLSRTSAGRAASIGAASGARARPAVPPLAAPLLAAPPLAELTTAMAASFTAAADCFAPARGVAPAALEAVLGAFSRCAALFAGALAGLAAGAGFAAALAAGLTAAFAAGLAAPLLAAAAFSGAAFTADFAAGF